MATKDPGVLRRIKSNTREDLPTVEKTVHNGNLTVTNVPFTQRKNGELGPDGEAEYLSSNVMYQLAGIFQLMIKEGWPEFNYREHEKLNK